ncbi:MAG: hypothetical protein PHQ23_05345 [Candidatus Wallbacteria bacterium]|nr:hypothetical protein [Candidatus Wallbacteria bacterium]
MRPGNLCFAFIAALFALHAPAVRCEIIEIPHLDTFQVRLKIEGEIICSREVSVSVPDRIWDGKIETILEEGTWVKTGEIIVRISAESMKNNAFDQSVEIQTTTLDQGKKALDQQIDSAMKDFDLAEARHTLSIEELSLAGVKAGTDPRLIRKKELERSVLSKQIAFQESVLAGERLMLGRGFISQLQLDEQAVVQENQRLDLKLSSTEILLMKKRPGKLELFKAQSSFEGFSGRVLQLEQDIEFMKKSLELTVKSGEMEIERMKNELSTITDTINKCTICSPSSGIFVHPQENWWGDGEITTGSAVWARMGLGRVVNPDDLIVKCRVPEMDIEKVRLGQAAVIKTPAEDITGEVVHVGKMAVPLYPGVKVYEIKVAPSKPVPMIPGQQTSVELLVADLSDLFRIPVDFITLDSDREILPLDNGKTHDIDQSRVLLRDFNFVYLSSSGISGNLKVSIGE